MRRLTFLWLALLLGLTAAAADRVSWDITPRVTAPGQPFRLQINVESDVLLGGAQQAGRDIRPPRGMALRLSGQIVRSDSNEATLNYSGVAPEQEGEYLIPSFTLRFARKAIVVPEIKLIVSKGVAFRRSAQARAELEIADRTFYVGELIRGTILMRGGEQEMVVANYGLESAAEGFTFAVTGDRLPLPDELGQGTQTNFELTPIRAGESELILNGTMLIQGADISPFSNGGRDRPFAFRRRLTVEHVPESGRPADWSGAIGTFAAETPQVSKEQPEVGEPIRLRAVLTGAGNLDRLITPELLGGEQWDVLPATERRRSADSQRVFMYTLVPRLPGKLLTPAIRFSSFDPLTKKFSRIEFAPVAVTVTGSAPAKVELITAEHAFRFAATAAYDKLVRERITELRESPISGTQTIGEFMQRRLSPAMSTVAATAQRLSSLSERISRTSALLRTRVDIATEEQNSQLLAKLTKGQELQLRLQTTVEGLSIAAISYYVISLLLYLGKAGKAAGLPIHPEMAAGALVPLVLWVVWRTNKRIHDKLRREE